MAVGVVVGLYFLDPVKYVLMPKCPFKMLTGLSCPGCGIQRAIHALLHGDVAGAVKYNFFLVYSGPYAMAFVVQRWVLTGEWQRKVGDFIENKWLVNFIPCNTESTCNISSCMGFWEHVLNFKT